MSVRTIAALAAILSGTLWMQSASAQNAAPPPPAAPPSVTGTNVNLRQGPGTNYTVITLIPAGAPVGVSGCQAGWCQVSFAGQNGYIIATAIAPAGDPGGPPPGAMDDDPIPVAPGAPPPGYLPPPPPPPYYYGYGPYYGPYYAPYWRRGYYWHRHW